MCSQARVQQETSQVGPLAAEREALEAQVRQLSAQLAQREADLRDAQRRIEQLDEAQV